MRSCLGVRQIARTGNLLQANGAANKAEAECLCTLTLDQSVVMVEDSAAVGQQPTVARITGQTFARPVHCESSRIGNKTPSTSVTWPSRRNGTEFREDAPKLPPLVWKIVTVFLFATGKPHQESAPRLTDESRGMVHLQEGDQRLAQRPVEYRKPRRHGERPSVG